MSVDVEKIAEAVLYEGYLLYPYRPSSLKNQQRWTFGGVYPRRYSEESGGDEPWHMQTQCLVLGDEESRLEVKLRFLQLVDRRVAPSEERSPAFVAELRVGEQVYRPGEEAAERSVVIGEAAGAPLLRLGDLLARPQRQVINLPAGQEREPLLSQEGSAQVMLLREWQALHGSVEISAEALAAEGTDSTAPASCYRLSVNIANVTAWTPPGEGGQPPRAAALRQTFISTHTILHLRDGEFVSLLEPPPEYQPAAASCRNIKTWPVLVGETGRRQTMLSSPIILYDYPQIAPESQGNFFDATEIDELLTLSVLALTDQEKQEMRESDARARDLLERTESLSVEQLMQLHGAVRGLRQLRRDEA